MTFWLSSPTLKLYNAQNAWLSIERNNKIAFLLKQQKHTCLIKVDDTGN